jgi:pimeloyl-ACP methyl ester carboxylesterase
MMSMPIVTTMVDVDGLSIRVRSAGLDARRPPQPVVVFESGGGAPLETWDPVLPAVAKFAPLVAYDRAGTGESAWDSLPPTPERVVARLDRLLAKLEVSPPYVLVGHSWGGALIRYFGAANSADIIGMLYLDPTDITQTPADEIALFETIGAGSPARDAFYEMMEVAMADAPAPLRAEGAVTLGLFRQDMSGRRLPEAPDVPTTVILAGQPTMLPSNILPFDTQRYADAVQRSRVHRLGAWVRGHGEFHVAVHCGHVIHADDPELVIETIRRLLDASDASLPNESYAPR